MEFLRPINARCNLFLLGIILYDSLLRDPFAPIFLDAFSLDGPNIYRIDLRSTKIQLHKPQRGNSLFHLRQPDLFIFRLSSIPRHCSNPEPINDISFHLEVG